MEREAGLSWEVVKRLSRGARTEGTAKKEDDGIQRLMKEAGIEEVDGQVAKALVRLVEAARSRSSTNFRYACELVVRPHAVTWREFRTLREAWTKKRSPDLLDEWTKAHAQARVTSLEDVEEELFGVIIFKRHERLAAASSFESMEDLELCAGEVEDLLEMVGEFLAQSRRFSPQRLRRLYDQMLYWIGFRTNATDRSMRDREEELILKLVTSAPESHAMGLLEVLRPWDSTDETLGDEQEMAELKDSLREKCVAIVSPVVAKRAMDLMIQDGGIRSLMEPGRLMALKFCLLSPRSPIWKGALQTQWFDLIGRGKTEGVIYRNTHFLLDLLIRELRSEVDYIRGEDVAGVVTDDAFVERLWATITSREIQYRMQVSILQARADLMRFGVAEVLLPLNKELQERSDAEKAKRPSQRSGAANVADEPLAS